MSYQHCQASILSSFLVVFSSDGAALAVLKLERAVSNRSFCLPPQFQIQWRHETGVFARLAQLPRIPPSLTEVCAADVLANAASDGSHCAVFAAADAGPANEYIRSLGTAILLMMCENRLQVKPR